MAELIGIIMIVSWIYFLPTIIGFGKRNTVAIFFCNLIFGWTLIGWGVSFVWACVKD